MLDISKSAIDGCFEIKPKIMKDSRGKFVKTFHRTYFEQNSLQTEFDEQYYSVSRKNVIRGMHFQKPPADHVKLVYCTSGEVFDVVLDIRHGSRTYGKTAFFELTAEKGNCVYIPRGMAHGFCVRSDEATMIYNVSSTYSELHDCGILWNSIGISWPTSDPIVSGRDGNFLELTKFSTPFI